MKLLNSLMFGALFGLGEQEQGETYADQYQESSQAIKNIDKAHLPSSLNASILRERYVKNNPSRIARSGSVNVEPLAIAGIANAPNSDPLAMSMNNSESLSSCLDDNCILTNVSLLCVGIKRHGV